VPNPKASGPHSLTDNLIEIEGLRFVRGDRIIFDGPIRGAARMYRADGPSGPARRVAAASSADRPDPPAA
jgi:hypothetical protein